jgi:hypothetical protein
LLTDGCSVKMLVSACGLLWHTWPWLHTHAVWCDNCLLG